MLGPQEISFRHFGDTNASLWGGSILNLLQKFENVRKPFLTKFFQVNKQTLYTLLLETTSLPNEIMAIERLLKTCFRFKKVPNINILESYGKQAKRSKRCIKTKFCVIVYVRYGKMVW